MGDDIKTILKNKQGQDIFEMIIFLPFLIFLYTIFYTVGNAISASINQQKAVRGYFYHLVKGNSYINSATDIEYLYGKGRVNSIGFFAIGWTENSIQGASSTPNGNCFKFSSLLKNNSTEECKDSVRENPEMSIFVRAFTVYGVCGPIYTVSTDYPEQSNRKKMVVDQSSQMGGCVLK